MIDQKIINQIKLYFFNNDKKKVNIKKSNNKYIPVNNNDNLKNYVLIKWKKYYLEL